MSKESFSLDQKVYAEMKARATHAHLVHLSQTESLGHALAHCYGVVRGIAAFIRDAGAHKTFGRAMFRETRGWMMNPAQAKTPTDEKADG